MDFFQNQEPAVKPKKPLDRKSWLQKAKTSNQKQEQTLRARFKSEVGHLATELNKISLIDSKFTKTKSEKLSNKRGLEIENYQHYKQTTPYTCVIASMIAILRSCGIAENHIEEEKHLYGRLTEGTQSKPGVKIWMHSGTIKNYLNDYLKKYNKKQLYDKSLYFNPKDFSIEKNDVNGRNNLKMFEKYISLNLAQNTPVMICKQIPAFSQMENVLEMCNHAVLVTGIEKASSPFETIYTIMDPLKNEATKLKSKDLISNAQTNNVELIGGKIIKNSDIPKKWLRFDVIKDIKDTLQAKEWFKIKTPTKVKAINENASVEASLIAIAKSNNIDISKIETQSQIRQKFSILNQDNDKMIDMFVWKKEISQWLNHNSKTTFEYNDGTWFERDIFDFVNPNLISEKIKLFEKIVKINIEKNMPILLLLHSVEEHGTSSTAVVITGIKHKDDPMQTEYAILNPHTNNNSEIITGKEIKASLLVNGMIFFSGKNGPNSNQ